MLLFQLYYNKNIVVFLYSHKSSLRFTSHSSYSEIAFYPKMKREIPLRTKDLINQSRVFVLSGDNVDTVNVFGRAEFPL